MVEILEQIDQVLMENRDKARFKNKEKNSHSIQTLVGNVDFERRYYWDEKEHDWVYLLDEALGLEAEKTIGPGLLELAVIWATKGPSYRDSRDRLTDIFGAQVLSHEAIRQALLEVATACERDLQNSIVAEEGKREVKALFIEVDDFNARFQKNKKNKRNNHRREAKMARTALRLNKDALYKANIALRQNKMGILLQVVNQAWLDCTDIKQKEKLEALKDLLLADYEFIVDYRVRLKKEGFLVPIEWRGLGAAESNVNKFKNRTSKRGRAWSPEGFKAILMTLKHLFEGTLSSNISRTLDEEEEWLLDKVTSGVLYLVIAYTITE